MGNILEKQYGGNKERIGEFLEAKRRKRELREGN